MKYTLFSDVDGSAAPMLLIVAIEGMPPEECFVAEIQGLSFSPLAESIGYMMFLPTRVGNKKSNKWFHEVYMISHILKCDEMHFNLPGGHMKPEPAVYYDGEAGPLNAAVDEDVLAKYRSSGIHAVKGVRSFWDFEASVAGCVACFHECEETPR